MKAIQDKNSVVGMMKHYDEIMRSEKEFQENIFSKTPILR